MRVPLPTPDGPAMTSGQMGGVSCARDSGKSECIEIFTFDHVQRANVCMRGKLLFEGRGHGCAPPWRVTLTPTQRLGS